jgi:TolB-like protein/DNA-binding winged helix-turn-helix (wHTH) protein/Tfp pilus assembly protein PilF
MFLREKADESVRFGCFQVNLETGELLCEGRRVRLSGQSARVLLVLLRHAGQLVTRDELRALLWPGETFVDFDHGLNNCINRIRDALRGSTASPAFIETLPKRGYRFIGSVVQDIPERGGPAFIAEEVSLSGVDSPPPRPAFVPPQSATRGQWYFGVSLLAIIIATSILIGVRARKPESPAALENVYAVAVLPVTNLSGDPSQEFLSDALTDQLITELARSTTASVTSRTSVMRYKNKQAQLPSVARELGVAVVVESSLERTGNHLTIRAHLIRADTDTHLWAERYDAEINELPQAVAHLASDLGARLPHAGTSRAATSAPLTVSPEAYELYLRGQFLWNRWQIEPALRHFQRAADLEPGFAAPYGGIAKSYCRLEYTQVMPASVAFPPAAAAAQKALELDPANAEAHVALSYLCANRDWDFERSEQEMKTAIALDPGSSLVHRWYRYILERKGRKEEALEQARLSSQADPSSAQLLWIYGRLLGDLHRPSEALAAYKESIELDSTDPAPHFSLAAWYEANSDPERAAAEAENAYRLDGKPALADQFRKLYHARGYTFATHAASRARLLLELQPLNKKAGAGAYVSPSAFANVYAELGDRENTLRWLATAYTTHSHVMTELRDDRFDFVRQDPRFRRIWDKVPFAH